MRDATKWVAIDGQGSLGCGIYVTKAEFFQQSSLVDLLEKSGAKSVGDLENSAQDALRKRIEESAFIGVHQRQYFYVQRYAHISRAKLLAADQRR
jgi:hypothetical protein